MKPLFSKDNQHTVYLDMHAYSHRHRYQMRSHTVIVRNNPYYCEIVKKQIDDIFTGMKSWTLVCIIYSLKWSYFKPKYWTHSEFDLIMLLALTILWWGISMSLQHFMAHRRIVVEIPQSGPTPWKNRPTNRAISLDWVKIHPPIHLRVH